MSKFDLFSHDSNNSMATTRHPAALRMSQRKRHCVEQTEPNGIEGKRHCVEQTEPNGIETVDKIKGTHHRREGRGGEGIDGRDERGKARKM